MREYNVDPPKVDLDETNFVFAVKIDHDNFLKVPLFNLTLEQRDYVTLRNGTKVKNKFPVQLEPCTQEHWSKLLQYGAANWTEIYSRLNFQSFLCPKKGQKFIIGGNYNSDHFYHLKFGISKCQNNYPSNSLWKPTCANDTQINNFFNANTNVRFVLYTNNFLLNPLKSEDYVSSFAEESLFFSVQKSGAYQTADIFYTIHNVITDESILPFKDLKNDTFFTYQNGNFRPQYVIGPPSQFYAEFYIRMDTYSSQTKRQFQKISEIISYIGGFSQIFILVTAIIVSLANKIYEFKFSSNPSKKKDQEKERTNARRFDSIRNFQNKLTQLKNEKSLEEKQDSRLVEIEGNQQKESKQKKLQELSEQGVQLNDIEMNVVNKESDSIKRNQEIEAASIHLKKRKPKTREDGGLLPLDEIKSIISRRKTLIINSMNQQKIEKMRQLQNSKQMEDNKGDNDIIVQTEGEDNVSIVNDLAESKKQNSLENIKQSQTKQYGLFSKLQQKSEKIFPKDEDGERIDPETPLQDPNSQMQSPQKLQKQAKQPQFKSEIEKDINKEINKDQQYIDSDVCCNKVNYDSFIDQKQININDYGITSKNALLKSNQQCTLATQLKTPTPKSLLQFQFNDVQIKSNSSKQMDLQQSKNNPEDEAKQIQNKIFEGLGFKTKKQFLTQEFEFLLKKDSNIQMTVKFFLYKITCGKFFRSEQVLLLDKANKQMKKDLDIFMIINKLKELEKFKSLFLDKHQEVLFNFFPKPVISVENRPEIQSRAEVIEQVRKRGESQSITTEKIIVKDKQQKKFNMNFKTAALVSKAATQFKKPITEKINEFNNMIAYKKLYEAYEIIQNQEKSQFNQKLVEQLGDEMNKIFEISNMITLQQPNLNSNLKPNQNIKWDSSNSLNGQNQNKDRSDSRIKQQQRAKNDSLLKEQISKLEENVTNRKISINIEDSNTRLRAESNQPLNQQPKN